MWLWQADPLQVCVPRTKLVRSGQMRLAHSSISPGDRSVFLDHELCKISYLVDRPLWGQPVCIMESPLTTSFTVFVVNQVVFGMFLLWLLKSERIIFLKKRSNNRLSKSPVYAYLWKNCSSAGTRFSAIWRNSALLTGKAREPVLTPTWRWKGRPGGGSMMNKAKN